MRKTLSPPIVGQSLSASWGKKLSSDMRAGRIIAGKNIYVRYTNNGTEINCSAVGGMSSASVSTLDVWDVVWVPLSDTDPSDGEWQVYAPIGALTVKYAATPDASVISRSYTAMCMNEKGSTKDGKTFYGWFKIPEPDVKDSFVFNDTYAVKAWTVYVEVKPWARFWVTTDPTANDPIAWKEPIATICEMTYTDEKNVSRTSRYAIQLQSGAFEKIWDSSGPFALEYILANPSSANSAHYVQVINQTKMLGRLQKNNVDPVVVSGKSEVWVKVSHENDEFDLELLTTVTDTASNDDQTVYKIYDLNGDVVKADYRESIGDLPFYTNPAKLPS